MKLINSLCIAILCGMPLCSSIYAEEVPVVEEPATTDTVTEEPVTEQEPVDETAVGTISITLTDTSTHTPKSNVIFQISKVADYKEGDYILTDTYKEAKIKLPPKTASELESDALTLAKIKDTSGTSFTITTDESGYCISSNLEMGYYLVQAINTAQYNDVITPFLVRIPEFTESGTIEYNVNVTPKHSPKEDKNKKNNSSSKSSPPTAAALNYKHYFGAGAFFGIAAIFMQGLSKRKE